MKRKYGSLKFSILWMEEKDVFLLASGESGSTGFIEPDAGWPDGWND